MLPIDWPDMPRVPEKERDLELEAHMADVHRDMEKYGE